MMKVQKNRLEYSFFLLHSIFLMIYLLVSNINILLISIFLLWVFNFIFSLKNLKKLLVYCLFHISFFVFLISKPFFQLLIGNEGLSILPEIVTIHSLVCVYLSLLSFSIVAIFLIEVKNNSTINYRYKDEYFEKISIKNLRKISKMLFYTFFPIHLIVLLEKTIFVQKHDFKAYHVLFESQFPIIFSRLGDVTPLFFYVFLATMPKKIELRNPMFLFVLGSLLTLGIGQRNGIIVNLLIILFYLTYREFREEKLNYWISKRLKMIIPFIGLSLIFLSAAFEYYRRDVSLNKEMLKTLFLDFFNSQGSTFDFIGYAYLQHNDILTQSVPYTFGAIYIYLTQNYFSRLIFGFPELSPNTVEMALNGNSFGNTLSYEMYPVTYLQGVGMGSSYIAELFYDFNYIGVFIGSLLLGWILIYLPKLMSKNWITFSLGILMIRNLLLLPRASYFDWVAETITILNLTIILLILILLAIFHELRRNKWQQKSLY